MPVTRANELDARSADNAKELLALDPVGLNAAVRECARITAPEIDDAEFERIKADNSPRYRNTVSDMERVIRACLSARQQASVEEVARSIAFQEWPLARTDERAKWVETHWQRYAPEARALLAKYDIFQKVEG